MNDKENMVKTGKVVLDTFFKISILLQELIRKLLIPCLNYTRKENLLKTM
jgi:hypothetical protein